MRFEHNIDDLANDLARIRPKAKADLEQAVKDGIRVGNTVAKDNARRSSGTHARKYPGKFSHEMHRGKGLFGNVTSGEYGPRAEGQGLLANILENGSRNNPPHLDLARSADLIGPAFAAEVRAKSQDWFW